MNCVLDLAKLLEMDEPMNGVFAGEAFDGVGSMFVDTSGEAVGDADMT